MPVRRKPAVSLDERTALKLAALLQHLAAQPCLEGGWGVDALVGRTTRAHRDLDVTVRAESLQAVLTALTAIGWQVQTDWLPIRVELERAGAYVDLHPLNYQPDGSAWQAGPGRVRFHYPADGWTRGHIAGTPVRCLSAEVQWQFHQGYPPRAVDRHDLALLARLTGRAQEVEGD